MPPGYVRFIGSPAVLGLCCAAAVGFAVDWMSGGVTPFLAVLIMAGAAVQSFKCFSKVRVAAERERQFNAFGEAYAPAVPDASRPAARPRKWIELALLVVALFVVARLLPHPIPHYVGLMQNAERIPGDELWYVIAWFTVAYGLLIKTLVLFRGTEWVYVPGAVLAWFGIGFYLAAERQGRAAEPVTDVEKGLLLLWLAASAFLLWKLARWGWLMVKRNRVRAIAQRPRDGFEAVTWLLPRAASSPSRIEAQRNLPEYAARLLEPVETRA